MRFPRFTLRALSADPTQSRWERVLSRSRCCAPTPRLLRAQQRLRVLLLACSVLLLSVVVPASPVHLAQGYGGGAAVMVPTCGSPAAVFATLLKGQTYTLPTMAQLMQLPTPAQHPVVAAGDATYDPLIGQLCAGAAVALTTHFAQTPVTAPPTTTPTFDPTTYGLEGTAISIALGGIWAGFQQWLRDTSQKIMDGAASFGFFFQTPSALTYGHDVVKNLAAWMILVVDSMLALALIIGGYRYMFGLSEGFRQVAPALLVAAIGAHFIFGFLGQIIEVQNTLCTGILAILATVGIGNLTLPLGVINWATAPEYLILLYLLDVVVSVLLIGQMLLRLALLDLLLVTAPLGWFLCFGFGKILPGARAWGLLWAQLFTATLITQPLQLLVIGLGSALMASFGHGTITPVSLLVGIAALFLAGKIPDLLLTNLMRAIGSRAMNDMGQTIASGVETVAVLAA